MKLSEIKAGDIFSISNRPGIIYIVITNTLWVERNQENKIVYFHIDGYRLFKGGPKIKFQLNRITPEEVRTDNYDISEMKKMDPKDLPLLVSIPNKTIWFERALNKDIHTYGSYIYPRMIKELENEPLQEKEPGNMLL